MTAKLKARTWYDLHNAIGAIIKVATPQFKLDSTLTLRWATRPAPLISLDAAAV